MKVKVDGGHLLEITVPHSSPIWMKKVPKYIHLLFSMHYNLVTVSR